MSHSIAVREPRPTRTPWYVEWMSRGLLPDPLVRAGIRRRLRQRLEKERGGSLEERDRRRRALVDQLRRSRIAIHTDAANRQHYEVPAEFFQLVLGPHLKYSSALWDDEAERLGPSGLARAEQAMLETYCRRADLQDGQRVLDLGCGWGSFSLYAAPRYPRSRFLAVSNSHGQRRFIEEQSRARAITNLEVVTSDANEFLPRERFDRVVSIEMFEHMRNYRDLLARIAGWLEEDGRLFVHIFTHRDTPYLFEATGGDEWMAENFFTGGIMPSDDLLLHFQDDVRVLDHWRVDGRHYEKTANAWLARLDVNRDAAEEILTRVHGKEQAGSSFASWRLFFLACAELWGYDGGAEWMVSHYLFAPRRAASGA